MSAANIENILSQVTQDFRKRLEEAFEAGRAKEREDMRRQLDFLWNGEAPSEIALRGDTPELDNFVAAHIVTARILARAQAGTVKPAIKVLIEKAPNGISTSEIIEKTGFKVNSVRGTLSTLKVEGFAERHGELWFNHKGKAR